MAVSESKRNFPFTAKGFPIDQENRLALDRVKYISVMGAPTAVKALKESIMWKLLHIES